ncbi:Histone deacetylase HDT1 [Linum grandiflorum]
MSCMQFWGVEVKAGEPFTVTPDDDFNIHLSHAVLGESNKSKDTESVLVSVTVNGKKLALGTLSAEKFPQLQFDLVFEKEFVLSHNGKNGSVYFSGYRCISDEYPFWTSCFCAFYETESSDEEEDVRTIQNGNAEEPKLELAKLEAPTLKSTLEQSAKPETDSDDEDDSDSDDEDDSDDSDEDDSSDESGEEMSVEGQDDSDDSDEDSKDEVMVQKAPKKPESGKKRPASDSPIKTPVSNKKAKQSTPQKKGGHTDTPHPVKKDGKPAAAKPTKTAKSAGSVACKNCEKKFTSEAAMESHSKAKHA